MKLTLTLKLFPRELAVDPTIHGNIDEVLEKLGGIVCEENALLDLSGLRGLPVLGKFAMCTCGGDLENHQVLDIMNSHQGIVVLRPGEYLTFEFEGDYVLVYNLPRTAGKAYIFADITERSLDLKVAEQLRQLRAELAA